MVVLDIDGAGRVFGSERLRVVALDDVSLRVSAGEFVAVMGPSGSGKSTLLRLAGGLDRPTSGRVLLAGRDLAGLDEAGLAEALRREIGFVFQEANLLASLTATENVALALELDGARPKAAMTGFQLIPTLTATENATLPLDLARIRPAHQRKDVASRNLAMVGLGDRGDRLPLELSGGEQQRVAIARAMACGPPILLGDEPTGNLDTRLAQDMFGLLKGLNGNGTTVVYVTHDQSLAALASRIVSVRDGLIVDDTARRP